MGGGRWVVGGRWWVVCCGRWVVGGRLVVVCVVGGEWWVMGGRWWVVMVMMVVGSGANAELIASELLLVGRRIKSILYHPLPRRQT